MYSLRTDSGVMCVPESWTDRKVQPENVQNSRKIPFDALTLRELAQLIQAIEGLPITEKKSVDKVNKER